MINKILKLFNLALVPLNEWKELNRKNIARVARNRSNKKEFKERVRSLIEQRCWNCGCSENLQIHHIVPIKDRPDSAMDLNNLIMLCGTCHSRFHQDCPESKKEER
jgi:5-methylcytosine-specific restriction endonuclease McrA